MELETIQPTTINVERSEPDTFVLRSGDVALTTIRRGADGWKVWLRSCEFELGGHTYRTQAAMWKPEVSLVDEQGVTHARDTLNGPQHTVDLSGRTILGDGSHDVERWQTADGAPLLSLRWQGTYAELAAMQLLQPLAVFDLVALAAFALHAGSTRGGDRQSW